MGGPCLAYWEGAWKNGSFDDINLEYFYYENQITFKLWYAAVLKKNVVT